ncbi:MAG TPA: Arm DNA-binding domain-containing protein [Hanamia sp.]|jgi:hypothetical protein|nr:Arm DNA-binding domain-containing protein [Hanamia sp.]
MKDFDIEKLECIGRTYKKRVAPSLYIVVNEKGRKYFRFKYRFNNKEKSLALGVFPTVKVANAIAGAEKARNLLSEKIDPSTLKRLVKSKDEQVFITKKIARLCADEIQEVVRKAILQFLRDYS